jgi:CO/xanthine dehydrogenase Mo-binding subunit
VIEIDSETGQSHLLRVVCADDVGKAINPRLVEGQIEGAVVQAAGYALLEDFQQEGGRVSTAHLSTYLIPTIVDVPDSVDPVILEFPDPIGPWGARGMAEMPYLPLAPAVIAAAHDAVGVWLDEFPLTPPRVLRGLRRREVR